MPMRSQTFRNTQDSLHHALMTDPLTEYYRCSEGLAKISCADALSETPGFFRFGADILYGRCAGPPPAAAFTRELYDSASALDVGDDQIHLPFDPFEIVDNLRLEKYTAIYAESGRLAMLNALARRLYYLIRPALHVSVRKHIQKLHFRIWNKVGFPGWPVDCTVDRFMEKLMLLTLRAARVESLPFIWFWPEGMPSALIMTHDVETRAGRDFCNTLMDIDDAFGLKSSFQIVPEVRYPVPPSLLAAIQDRGFEVNIHDLNHDGNLFQEKNEFFRRAARINQYLKQFGAIGFRAAIMYRKQNWLEALDASYDMSVPSAAHLDPQRGGCCTVMPYFIGHLVELPVTMTQDYALFNILGRYSTDLWKQQIDAVIKQHGLISFIVHPDYVIEKRARATYSQLLQLLAELRFDKRVWCALPSSVNSWWRQRNQMRLVRNGRGWTIEGPGRERARVAYAYADGDRLAYSIVPTGSDAPLCSGKSLSV